MSDISVQQLPLTLTLTLSHKRRGSVGSFAVCCVLCAVLLAGCGAATAPDAPVEAAVIAVSAQSVAASRKLPVDVTYPGVVASEAEVRVTANASGVVKNILVNLGSSVTAGQVLARIIDPNSASVSTAQVENARLAMEQARAAFEQAKRNVGHTTTTTNETVKSAELAVESANLAVEQAKLALANKRLLASQAETDVETNGLTTSQTYANAASGVLDGLNNLTGFDDKKSVTISYGNYLGALDAKTVTAADSAYDAARRAYDDGSPSASCDAGATTCLTRTAAFLAKVKTATDNVVTMLDKSVPAADFPLSSSTTTSLAGLKSTATGYQTTLNTGIAAVNAALQALTNTKLNNKTAIDQLAQALSLSEKQASQATQSLASLKATNVSTRDTIGTQVSTAELAYKNALVNYQNLTNNREVTAPISGVITKKSVSDGDAVNAGQQLFTISKPGNVKIELYVDEQQRSLISLGAPALVTDSDQSTYQATVSRIAPTADTVTKRFLIECLPSDTTHFPPVGAVVDVRLQLLYATNSTNTFFVPLYALTIGQNESTIFTVEKELATAVTVKVIRVAGEYAEVQADLPDTALIITEGARNVLTGTKVKVQ